MAERRGLIARAVLLDLLVALLLSSKQPFPEGCTVLSEANSSLSLGPAPLPSVSVGTQTVATFHQLTLLLSLKVSPFHLLSCSVQLQALTAPA